LLLRCAPALRCNAAATSGLRGEVAGSLIVCARARLRESFIRTLCGDLSLWGSEFASRKRILSLCSLIAIFLCRQETPPTESLLCQPGGIQGEVEPEPGFRRIDGHDGTFGMMIPRPENIYILGLDARLGH